jgi:cephalosporin hydroxylase
MSNETQQPSVRPDRNAVVRDFALLWWNDRRSFFSNTYLGVPTLQHPFDAWITQEIICEVRPEVVVEIGSYCGGSAVMWAMLLEQLDPHGFVVAVDIEDNTVQARQLEIFERRVRFIQGSSLDPEVIEEVFGRVGDRRALVILDSAHNMAHVRAELDAYAPLVAPGSYLIVQDTAINGHPIEPGWGPGPYEAVEDFLARDDRFVVDWRRERMMFTLNPGGFLWRKGGANPPPDRALATKLHAMGGVDHGLPEPGGDR